MLYIHIIIENNYLFCIFKTILRNIIPILYNMYPRRDDRPEMSEIIEKGWNTLIIDICRLNIVLTVKSKLKTNLFRKIITNIIQKIFLIFNNINSRVL